MFRFTIRDVLWLTVVAAVSLGWASEFLRSPSRQLEFRAKAMKSAIEGEGYTVEQPTPFTVKVRKPGVQIEIVGEGEQTSGGDPFGADPNAGKDPFGDPFGQNPNAGKDPFGQNPNGNDAGGDPFAAK